MSRRAAREWGGIFGGAALAALGFALYARVEGPSHFLGWFGLVPWLAALDRVHTARRALAAGLIMTELFAAAVFFWFAEAIRNYTGVPLPLALGVLLATAPLLQPQFLVFSVARTLARRGGFWLTALAGAGVYTGSEWLLPKLFSDTIGHGLLAARHLRQAADLTGAPGLTFLLLLGNECALASLRALAAWRIAPLKARRLQARGPMICFAAMIGALLLYGEVRLRQLAPDRNQRALTAAIVQADVSQYGRLAEEMGTYEAARMILDTHFSLSREALGRGPIDVLVWPETVYPTTFGTPKSADGAAFDREIAGFVARAGVPLLFGSYDVQGGREYNAAILLEPPAEGETRFSSYLKARPFPFTERVPAPLDTELVRRWFPWLGTWQAGRGPAVLPLELRDGREVPIGPLICYDAVAPDLALEAARQGAEVIFTLSNDSWFADGGGPRLHLVVSAFRTLESRRPQFRATTTGISAVIDATGELVQTLGVHQRGVLVASLAPERNERTLMMAWGDWFPPVALLLGLGALAAARLRRASLDALRR